MEWCDAGVLIFDSSTLHYDLIPVGAFDLEQPPQKHLGCKYRLHITIHMFYFILRD